jgi:hypothetical protein
MTRRLAAEEAATEAAIVDFLKSQPEGVVEKAILETVEGRRGAKVKALRWLVESGQVARTGQGGKRAPFRYAVPGSCSLVPSICGEQEDKNHEKRETPPPERADSCSQDFSLFEASSESREHESEVIDPAD